MTVPELHEHLARELARSRRAVSAARKLVEQAKAAHVKTDRLRAALQRPTALPAHTLPTAR